MTCRTCKKKNIYRFLSLGNHPPANEFLIARELSHPPRTTAPLNVQVCLQCALIHVPNNIPAGFFGHYMYVPSASAVMVKHFSDFAGHVRRDLKLARGALVVDIGSNDGTFLSNLKGTPLRILGVEPAVNLATIARRNGVETVTEYFQQDTALAIRQRYGAASVIVTTNTLNHIDDLHGFVTGVASLLDDDGVFIVEVPHATRLLAENQFDTIYHEHLSEFSVTSLVTLLRACGMEVFRITRLPLHGGSMRVYGRKTLGARRPAAAVVRWCQQERQARLFSRATYDQFTARVKANKKKTLRLLRRLKQRGCQIVGYGAPAKGSTLLNYYRIGTATLDYVVDRSPLKQGLYTPGMHIPIFPTEKILEDQPDYVLLLAWNFKDEIIRQQREYLRRGGKFITPIPEPKILHR